MSQSSPLYERIGVGYNLTRQADPYLTEKLFQLLSPAGDGKYLDIGCGTGNYTLALVAKGVSFAGVEPSAVMLSKAKEKSEVVNWVQGEAEKIPFPDSSFDGAIATLTVHHWKDIESGFRELSRVLKKNARLVVFTALPEQMEGYWLNHYFPLMMQDSTLKMPSFGQVYQASSDAGFSILKQEKYFIREDIRDLFLYSGKNNPQLYLSEEVRKGISTFYISLNPEELSNGLVRLENDIESGLFETVKEKFDNDRGDYLFICFEKNDLV